MRPSRFAIVFALSVGLPVMCRAGAQPSRENNLAAQVRAVFSARCAGCHGADVDRPRGGFNYVLDLARVRGNAQMVIPSSPEQSELWMLVRNGEMPPPDAPALTASQKEVIHAWIAAGAPVEDSPAVQEKTPNQPGNEVAEGPPSRSAVERAIFQLGKFHLLFLHFPIALLLAAGLAELWATWTGARIPLPAVRYCIGLGAIAAVPTVALGWLYALHGHAGALGLLALHRWVGTAGGAWAVATAVGSEWDARRGVRSWVVRMLLLLGVLLIAVAAHLGGLLTHGKDFW
jgi:mono/diheme cytochrome c family protein